MVTTSSHDPEKVILNFSCHELTSSEKDLLSKKLRFPISPTQIDDSQIHVFISRLLTFLFCDFMFSFHPNSENHSYNFLVTFLLLFKVISIYEQCDENISAMGIN